MVVLFSIFVGTDISITGESKVPFYFLDSMIKEFYNGLSKKLRGVVIEFERKRTGQESCEPW